MPDKNGDGELQQWQTELVKALEGTVKVIVVAPAEPYQSVAARLGLSEDEFWKQLDSGQLVQVFITRVIA